MRIDTQVTLWKEPSENIRRHPHFPGDERAYLPEHIEPILARNRFDGALLIDPGGSARQLAQLAEWRHEHPLFLGIVAAWSGEPHEVLPDGIRDALRAYWLEADSPSIGEAAAHCQRNQLALDIVPGQAPLDPGSLLKAATANPDTFFVLSHAGGPPSDNAALARWMDAMRELAQAPKMYVKLSGYWSTTLGHWGMPMLQSLFAFLLEIFGKRRLIFGTDWPYSLPEHSWKECLARFTQSIGAQSMRSREYLLGRNAIRAYRLPIDPGSLNLD